MDSLSENATWPASLLICNYLICEGCGIVDKDMSRTREGHRCENCNAESECGSLHLPISIHVLVDMIQQTYHSQSSTGPPNAPQGEDVGTVIYYCSLREALLSLFLTNNLKARNVDGPLIKKLFGDNKLASQKFGGLFTAVVGEKWDRVIDLISKTSGHDFRNVSELMKQASEHRNEFLHEGRAWGIDRKLSTDCINSLPDLVSLFVHLHNEYTQPLLQRDA